MKSLYGKFLVITALLMFGSTLIAFVTMNAFYQYYLKDNHVRKNIDRVERVAHYIEEEQPSNLDDYLTTAASTGYKIIILAPDGTRTDYGDSFRVDNLPERAKETIANEKIYNGMGEFPTNTFMTGFFADESRNTIGAPFIYQGKTYGIFMRPDIRALFTEVHYLLGGMILIIAVLSFLVIVLVTKQLIRPLTQLMHVTKKVGASEVTKEELPTERQDEIGELSKSFLAMIERLEQNELARKQFMSDVSHDFQSPLSSIKGYAKLLASDQWSKEEREKYAQTIANESNRLSNLTKQLLDLTAYDQQVDLHHVRSFSLDEQIHEVVRTYTWQLMEKGLSLSTDLEPIEMEGDPSALMKVWDNVLSNALKYTEVGEISITTKLEGEHVIVRFKDTGIGLTEEEQALAFDRFYRADQSRTKGINGTGLGLPIIEQIIRLHGGTVELISEKNVGTEVKITLPQFLSVR